MMGDFAEELEPLFDYSRVQPQNIISLDDDDDDAFPSKRKKISSSVVEKVETNPKVVEIVDTEDKEDDWLAPPPLVLKVAPKVNEEDSTLKELRMKKQELVSFAQSAKDILLAAEDSAKRKIENSLQTSGNPKSEETSNPPSAKAKIDISLQDNNGQMKFRMFMDDHFQRLFKIYADKVKLDIQSLVFLFDGDKIGPSDTPDSLGMDDNDIIEVHMKKH